MSSGHSQSATAVSVARQLLQRTAPPLDDPVAAAAALQHTCTRVFANLRESLGDDGCNALLARALSRTEVRHPSLKRIRRLYGDRIHLDGVAASVEQFGVPAVTEGLEALLATLVEVLGRLIGDDMALRLIDSDTRQAKSNGASTLSSLSSGP